MHRDAVVLALLLLAGTGCGKGGEVTIDARTSSGGTARVTAGATGTVSLPAGFPKDIPSPRDSTVGVTVAQGKTLMVTFRAKGTVPECLAYYQEQLKAQGWTLKPATEMGGTSFVLQGKKDKRECTVMITPGEGETVVQVHAPPE